MTTHSRLARPVSRTSLLAALAALAAAPLSAGVDWGLCPAPGVEGNELGADRYYVEATGADDDQSGGSSCTLRDAIGAVMNNIDEYGCTVTSVGSPGPGAIRAVILPSGSYAYTLNGSELYWGVDPKLGQGALCGHGPESSAIRAAESVLTAGHRVLRVDGPGDLFVYGVAIQYGQTIQLKLSGLQEGGGGPPEGGGVLVSGGAFLNLRSSLLSDNWSDTFGGGLACLSPLAPCYDLDHVVVAGNHAEQIGGGIYGNGDITTSIIAENTAGGSGGGLYTTHPPITLSPREGGEEPPTIMRNTWIFSNIAIDGGGGWYNSGYGEAAGVTISANRAWYGGGLVISGTVNENLNNVTVSGNRAEAGSPALTAGGKILQAGGVLLYNLASAALFNVTISGNRVIESPAPALEAGGPTVGAGLLVQPGSTIEYRQSFIAGNVHESESNLDDDCLLPKGLFSAGHNRAGVGCDLSGIGDLAADKADLLPLTDNGGLTSMDPMLDRTLPGGGFLPTQALVADSDAVDGGPAAGCVGVLGNSEVYLGTDARGFARAVDGDGDLEPICDIGAYEFKSNPAIWSDGFELKESPCNWSSVVDSGGLCNL